MSYALGLREPISEDAARRVARFANYTLATGEPCDHLGIAGDQVEITSGLTDGQLVATSNTGGLTDGQIVQPQIQALTALAH